MKIAISFLLVSITSLVFGQKNKEEKLKRFEGCAYGEVKKPKIDQCKFEAWELAFEDNFDDKELNQKNWKLPYQGILAGFDFANGGSKQWYANTNDKPNLPISKNIQVSNGTLQLIAVKEEKPIIGTYITDWSTNPPKRDTSSFDYSSAWIESQNHYGYGWYESRCKIPEGKGMWPAFWLFSGQDGFSYEIDIFEIWNEVGCFGNYDADRLSKNPHWNIHANHKRFPNDITCPTDQYKACKSWPEKSLADDFHIYALEWDAYKMRWYIDGIMVRDVHRYVTESGEPLDCNNISEHRGKILEAYFWPNCETMDVRFNLGVQYNGTYQTDKNDTESKVFEIDYFRFYKQKTSK